MDKAHLLQHMELGASCPRAAAGRAREAAPGARGPCQSLPTSTRCSPLPGSVTASCLGRDMGTDPCWPQLLAPGDEDMAQPHSPGEGALAAVQDGARGLHDLKKEEWTFGASSSRQQGQAAGALCPLCRTDMTIARLWGHTSLGTGDSGTDLNPF